MFHFSTKTLLNYVFFFVIAVMSGVAVVAYVESTHPSATQGLSRSGMAGYYIVRKPASSPSASQSSQVSQSSDSSASSTSTVVPVGSIDITLNAQEVSKHNTQNDCWLIIDNGIYDVTVYLPQHPGSASAIIPYCGTEASGAFHSKGGRGRDHARYVNSILAQYLIANLGETVQAIPVQPQVTVPADPAPTGGETNPGPVVQPATTLTTSEIAIHNNGSDCWIIVSGYVYNVTNFLPQHPGSASAITPYCGGDATGGLNGSSGSRKHNHSNYAYSLLNNYLVGAVGSSVTPPTGGSTPTPTPVPPSAGAGLPANVLKTFPSATLIKAEDGGREFKINSGGACYQIKTDAAGNVTQSEPC